jgi:hypothetical protein
MGLIFSDNIVTNSKSSHKLLYRDSELYDYFAYGVSQWT